MTKRSKANSDLLKYTRELLDKINVLVRERDEARAWQNEAMRIGEKFADVGPKGYYSFTSDEWFRWALERIEKVMKKHDDAEIQRRIDDETNNGGNSAVPVRNGNGNSVSEGLYQRSRARNQAIEDGVPPIQD